MLEKEEKNRWTAALRSGEHKQIKGRLKDNVGHCCIGVYTQINNIPLSNYGDHMLVDDVAMGYKPLTDKIGKENTDKLWKMNDNENKSFEEIADWIDENL